MAAPLEPKGLIRRAREVVSSVLLGHAGRDTTLGEVTLDELGLGHPERNPYVPSPWWYVRASLPRERVRLTDVFVDFGSGKGRVVLEAARRYPFARVIGIELSDELNEVSRALIASHRGKLASRDVEIVTADATLWQIPDDMTFAYLYNPFTGEVFRRVLENIVASYDRAPRELTLLYVQPKHEAAVRATGRFRFVRRKRLTRLVAPFEVVEFRTVPPPTAT